MAETIEAKELQLVRIFGDEYRFEIPEYQRPYAWTTEQTGELLDDLVYAMGKVEDVHDASPYFLGSIVIVKNGLQPQAQIVDGQQRVTTLTILLCVLRELAATESDSSDIHSYVYAPGRESAGIPGHYRLSVGARDRRFFQDNIQQKRRLSGLLEPPRADLPESQGRMLENAEYLFNSLAKHEEKRRKTLLQLLIQRCYFVVVSASSEDSAFNIRSVLNKRGLKLSLTDSLKADIVGVLPKDIRSRHAVTWEEIEEALGRDRFKDLFIRIGTIYRKNRPRGTPQEFQRHVLKEVDRANFIDKILKPYADAYATVVGATYERKGSFGNVDKYLRYLRWLANSYWIPPAMAFYKCSHSNPELLFRFVRDLERLAYALCILQKSENQQENRYAAILRAIEQGQDNFFPQSPLQISPKEQAEVLRTLDGPIYPLTSVCKPLLLRLDTLLVDDGAYYDHTIITIEHVLPQNPGRHSQWLRDFPDEEERKRWTDRLANLVLLSSGKNIKARNYEFTRKKEEYFQKGGAAPFALTTKVQNESSWTPAILERRQRELLDILKKEWRLSVETLPRPMHKTKKQDSPSYNVEAIRQEHPRAYAPWSSEEEERLKGMHAADCSIAEMARCLERQEGAIKSRLRKLGFDLGLDAASAHNQTAQRLQ